MFDQSEVSRHGEGLGASRPPSPSQRRFENEYLEDLALLINCGKRTAVVLCGTILGFSAALSAFLLNSELQTIILAYLAAALAGSAVIAAVLRYCAGQQPVNFGQMYLSP